MSLLFPIIMNQNTIKQKFVMNMANVISLTNFINHLCSYNTSCLQLCMEPSFLEECSIITQKNRLSLVLRY